jgi:AcrR family transcriptional regulator
VFFERGFQGASLEAVSEEAGLTKGAVYSRFESKADLFLAYQEERNEHTVRRFEQRAQALGPGDRPVDPLVGYWREKLLHDPPEYTLLVIEFWASACRDPEIHRRFSDQHERCMVGVAEALEGAAELLGGGLALPALELVRLSTGIAHGLALEQLLNREKVDERMIELAFMPIEKLSVLSVAEGRRAAFSDGRAQRRRGNDGGRNSSGRSGRSSGSRG